MRRIGNEQYKSTQVSRVQALYGLCPVAREKVALSQSPLFHNL